MAKCNCGQQACSCILQNGEGIEVTGSGTDTDPYVITATLTNLGQFLRVIDTPSVNLTLTGTGTEDDPLELRANSTLALTQLSDVDDPSGGPAVGEVPVWVGAGSAGHWEFQAPPITPAGSTNATNGITGTGSVGDPLKAANSGVWGSGDLAGLGSDSTIGLDIYIDSAGKLRAHPIATADWNTMINKPSSFPPSAHTHVSADITDLATVGNVAFIGGKKITTDPAHSTPPASTNVGDVFVYPTGAPA